MHANYLFKGIQIPGIYLHYLNFVQVSKLNQTSMKLLHLLYDSVTDRTLFSYLGVARIIVRLDSLILIKFEFPTHHIILLILHTETCRTFSIPEEEQPCVDVGPPLNKVE